MMKHDTGYSRYNKTRDNTEQITDFYTNSDGVKAM